MRGLAMVAAVIAGTAAMAPPAGAEEATEAKCEPACQPGAFCVKGTCMVPAPPPRPTPVPPPGYPPYDGRQPYPYPYPAPPQAYPPPGYGASTPPRPAPTGFLALPYVGINSFSGDETSGLDPGLRLGALLGGRVSEIFSMNGEITFDVMNPDEPAGVTATEVMLHLTFSPLFHVATSSAEFVIGPKLGLWVLSGEVSDGVTSVEIEEEGWTLGGNAGVFFPVGRGTTSLGMLVSYATLQLEHACVTITGVGKDCFDADGDASAVGLTFAALF